jgi:muramoyltetrapeptide carboxypeptidase LdcA involved in peptidoglycan recycling
MLYLWAAVFIGFSDTSTVLRLWASVGIITLGVAAVIALADKVFAPITCSCIAFRSARFTDLL